MFRKAFALAIYLAFVTAEARADMDPSADGIYLSLNGDPSPSVLGVGYFRSPEFLGLGSQFFIADISVGVLGVGAGGRFVLPNRNFTPVLGWFVLSVLKRLLDPPIALAANDSVIFL